MYSRLYTHVLNRYYWVESALAYSSLHSDNGLLGIYGACMPEYTGQLVTLLVNQLLSIARTWKRYIYICKSPLRIELTIVDIYIYICVCVCL
jgi:hypothetical protein